jgi:hypothetical protein
MLAILVTSLLLGHLTWYLINAMILKLEEVGGGGIISVILTTGLTAIKI